jgi:hypothetical protein
MLRELTHKHLIWLLVLVIQWPPKRENRRISRHNGKNREGDEAVLSTEAR